MKYLPESGENLFQRIKRLVREYEAINGVGSSINIAVGEPDTNPPELLRKLVAEEVLRDENRNHNYWDNGSPEGLNKKLIELNIGINIDNYSHIKTLVIPGEKPILGLLPVACGANRNDSPIENKGYMKNAPAYDVMATWCEYLGEESLIWPIYSFENFKLKISNLPSGKLPRMILTVKPGNPCPVGASKEEWEEIIDFCIKNKIRLVNDGAYTAVVHKNHVSLTSIAINYPELEWAELFSISKTFSACGWRIGTIVGTNDFIDEISKIKGNTDSGIFGPAGVGLNRYLDTNESKEDNKKIREMYKNRMDVLIPIFESAGLKLACPSDAGFFMLFLCPKTINGETIETSEEFNNKMINLIGLVGVPFVGSEIDGKKEQFIRYSACYDSLKEENVTRLKNALSKITITY
ncbi:MAG: aminotransferase class I/II-fold pyridoxal phosphate-dependent enzyme [Candidatus Gracilibacteria bacterium]|nr:aminotransferase class I/II-fold pyridoxal phosphate-dependent enzyme [Candidatus Gracilibacteria bacterium]